MDTKHLSPSLIMIPDHAQMCSGSRQMDGSSSAVACAERRERRPTARPSICLPLSSPIHLSRVLIDTHVASQMLSFFFSLRPALRPCFEHKSEIYEGDGGISSSPSFFVRPGPGCTARFTAFPSQSWQSSPPAARRRSPVAARFAGCFN